MNADEYRRARRRKVSDTIQVVDTMTDTVVGRLSNLSETGMLLIASVPLADDALYQFRFTLDSRGRAHTIEVGAHLLWQDPASATGQVWTGFRFINVADHQLQYLQQWLQAPGGTFE